MVSARSAPATSRDEELVREGVLSAEIGFLIRRVDELFDPQRRWEMRSRPR